MMDGGLAMLMGDLLTLKQLNLPVKVVVFNNSALAFIELEVKAASILDFATGLNNPNFAEVATAMGLFCAGVKYPEELGGALKDAFAHEGPALIDEESQRRGRSLRYWLWLLRCLLVQNISRRPSASSTVMLGRSRSTPSPTLTTQTMKCKTHLDRNISLLRGFVTLLSFARKYRSG